MDRGGNLPVLEGEGGFNEAEYSGCFRCMADIGFNRTNWAKAILFGISSKCLGDPLYFDRVA